MRATALFFVYYTNTTRRPAHPRFQTQAGNPDAADEKYRCSYPRYRPTYSNPTAAAEFRADGHLYFATGDGGQRRRPDNNSQNGNSLLGKMVRINVDNFTHTHIIPSRPTILM